MTTGVMADPTLATIEFTLAAVCFLLLITQYFGKTNSLSFRRAKYIVILLNIWLILDASSYILIGPAYPFFLRYTVNLLLYPFGCIVLLASILYADAFIRERTAFNPWFYRVPIFLLFLCAIAILIEFISGHIVVYDENGIEQAINGLPLYISILQLSLTIYLPIVAYMQRRNIKGFSLYLLILFFVIPALSIVVTLITGKDFTIIGSSLSFILSLSYLQHRLLTSQLSKEAERKALLINKARLFALEDSFEAVYDIELATGKYDSYDRKDRLYHKDVTSKLVPQNEFFEDLNTNIDRVILEEDRESIHQILTRENIVKELTDKEHFDYHYRLLTANGPTPYKMRIVYKDTDRKNVLVGVFNATKDIEAQQIATQREQLEQHLEVIGGLASEYSSLFYVNLDNGTYTVPRLSERASDLSALIEEHPAFEEFARIVSDSDLIHPDNRRNLLAFYPSDSYVRDAITDKKRISILFRRKYGEEYLWTEANIIKCEDADKEAHNILVGFIEKDQETRERNEHFKMIEETNKLIENVAAKYSFAFTVNLATNTFKLLRVDEGVKKYINEDGDFENAKKALYGLLHANDKERMMQELSHDTIRKKLKNAKNYTIEYRTFVNNRTMWHEMSVDFVDTDEVAIGFTEKDLEITKRHLEDMNYNEYLALFVVDLDTAMVKPLKTSKMFKDHPLGESRLYEKTAMNFANSFRGKENEFFTRIADIDYLRQDFMTDNKRTYTYKAFINGETKWIDITSYVILRHEDGTPAMITIGSSEVDALATERSELHNRLAENMQIIGGLASGYHALYYFNIEEKFFKIYSLDEHKYPEAAEIVNAGESATSTIQKFGMSELVHPDDRHLFANLTPELLIDQLAHQKRFSIRFRRNFNGTYLWTEMDVIKYEDINEKPNAITVGFAERDSEIRAKQALDNAIEILNRELSPEKAINKLLSVASEFYGAKHGYVFEYAKNTGTFGNTYEWCADGVRAITDSLQSIPLSNASKWNQYFEEHGASYIGTIDGDYIAEDAKQMLADRDVTSLVAAPIKNSDEIIGFVVIDNPQKATDNINVINSISTVILSEILKRRENDEEHITLGKLADTFLSVYYADLSADYMRTWKIDEKYSKLHGNIEKYSVAVEGYIRNNVAVNEQERCLRMTNPQYILDTFKTEDQFSIDMTDVALGKERHIVFDYIKVSKDGKQFVICSRDITNTLAKEKEQQRLLQDALHKADVANKAKTDFLFNMSHDIRTPMNAITGFTNMAIKHIDDKDKVLDCLAKTSKAEDILLSLTKSILEVSRIESGNAKLDEQPGDLVTCLGNIESTMTEMAESENINLTFEYNQITDRQVIADFDRCMRVLTNVISNAIKYTMDGGFVKVRCKQLGAVKGGYGTYQFTVADNGIGMSEEFQKHVFEQFARENTTTVSGIEGTGLGMSVAKSFVDLMGGTMQVKSKQGEGTTFTIVIPFKLQASLENTVSIASETTPEDPSDTMDFTGKKVLLVEDNELNREIAIDNLEDRGIIVENADDGTVAIERLREKGPDYYDFILMDIQMPKMNGYRATKAIRTIYPDKHIPIIALSANAFAEDKTKSLAVGMDDHVAKPINFKELFNALARLSSK